MFQPAHVVVVACNGVGTPRLLLNSATARCPDGLANSSGLVGRNLMFHPWAVVSGYVDEKLDGHRGSPLCMWSQEFYESDPSRGFVRGYEHQFGRGAQVISEGIQNMALGRIPWGEGHHDAFRHWSGRRFSVEVCCEDLPEAHNRVTLDPVLKDGHGIAAPRISYRISENSRRILAHGVARGQEIMVAAGASDMHVTCPVPVAGWHLLGTCRMGADPARSVVNEWGRSHDVKNLFVVDGSVFVTSGGVNPTTTIQAIALYIADQMKQRLATLFE